MIDVLFKWIIVGGANRIVVTAPELVDQGGVTPNEAFELLATELGRRARHCAQEIVGVAPPHAPERHDSALVITKAKMQGSPMSPMPKALDDVVEKLLASAMTAFTISDEVTDIKQSADALRALLHAWQTRSNRVESTVSGMLSILQLRCKHVGAKRGHNERDGAWMSPCPTCGASE